MTESWEEEGRKRSGGKWRYINIITKEKIKLLSLVEGKRKRGIGILFKDIKVANRRPENSDISIYYEEKG